MSDLATPVLWHMEHWSSYSVLAVKSMMRSVSITGICGICLWHHPSLIIFPCHHRVCERDIRACSVQAAPLSTLAHIEDCPVCMAPSQMTVRLRPPQCGFRLFTIDGGGVHGVSPLVMWKHLLAELPFGLKLSDYADLVVATSSGL
jgi:hypothetical protein